MPLGGHTAGSMGTGLGWERKGELTQCLLWEEGGASSWTERGGRGRRGDPRERDDDGETVADWQLAGKL